MKIKQNNYHKRIGLVLGLTLSSLLVLNNINTVKADSTTTASTTPTEITTTTTTAPAGIVGKVIASGLDGTAPYYITDKGILYFTDGELTKVDTAEIEGNYGNEITKIDTSLATTAVYAPTDSSYLFDGSASDSKGYDFSNVTQLDLSKLNTSKVTNMISMFSDLRSVKELDASTLDTSNVTAMGGVFYGMSELQSVNISSWDMSKVSLKGAGASRMFDNTALLKITLGPKNHFSDTTSLGTPGIYKAIGGWKNIGSGTETNPAGSLEISPTESLSKYYDGTGKTGVETFVPYDITNFTPMTFTENIYLNGSKNALSKTISVPFVDGSPTIPTDHSDPEIPSDWTLDSSKTTFQMADDSSSETISFPIDKLISGLGLTGNDVLLSNILDHFGSYGTSFAGARYILTKYYTSSTSTKPTAPTTPTTGNSGSTSGSDEDDTGVPLSSDIETVATYYDQPAVSLYSLYRRGSGSVSLIKNRALAPNSSWYVDKKVTINGINYLRVATNEWIKENQVYPYKDYQGVVITNNSGSYKSLYTAEGKLVGNRALADKTAWRSDRTIELDGTTYYRVATNEFVKASDVEVN